MERDFLLNELGLEKEKVDSIMAKYGKTINTYKEENEKLTSKVAEYETKIEELNNNSKNNEELSQELETLKQQIALEKEAKEREEKETRLNNNINEFLSSKKFINDFTKEAIVNKLKTSSKEEENIGKSFEELYNNITKDMVNIYEPENKLNDMPSMGESEESSTKAEPSMFW